MTPGTFSVDGVSLKFLPEYGFAILLVEVIYRDLAGRRHRASIGMPTDGLSIPRFFWRLAGPPFRHPYLLAAIIHDHYCYKAQSLPPGRERKAMRRSGDRLFREMVTVLGANRVQSWGLYRAVRTGAWSTRKAPQIPDYIHERNAFMAWYESTHASR